MSGLAHGRMAQDQKHEHNAAPSASGARRRQGAVGRGRQGPRTPGHALKGDAAEAAEASHMSRYKPLELDTSRTYGKVVERRQRQPGTKRRKGQAAERQQRSSTERTQHSASTRRQRPASERAIRK